MEKELIELNRSIYDAIAPLYEGQHREIFNATEQGRIRTTLRWCLQSIDYSPALPLALDFGAGTGNLTRHLLELGASTVASDISEGCLKQLATMTGRRDQLKTLLLDGSSLANIGSATFDLVATYSVLHHIPDYLLAVEELVRVVKPGGIIYIDHENSPLFWQSQQAYQHYAKELERCHVEPDESVLQRLKRVLLRKGLLRYLRAVLWIIGNRLKGEGDIHVHPEDHIDWGAIRDRLEPHCNILKEEDYLVCREQGEEAGVWGQWRERCVDMRVMIAMKKPQTSADGFPSLG